MADTQTLAAGQPWGRGATFGLAVLALLAGQLVALVTLTWWYGVDVLRLPDFSGDGPAVSVIVLTSTPVQLGLLALFAKMRGASAAEYLGLIWPSRSELLVGIASVVALIIVGDGISALVGHNIVTPFQNDIYRTAADSGWIALLWFAVVIMTPIGEETMFRGFLFRGWLRKPSDAWVVIAVTALLWAIIHVQYDWYVIGQVFVSGLLLGWLRWASGSTILTILLHGLINFEGMVETVLAAHG
jgi:hypothetical protein